MGFARARPLAPQNPQPEAEHEEPTTPDDQQHNALERPIRNEVMQYDETNDVREEVNEAFQGCAAGGNKDMEETEVTETKPALSRPGENSTARANFESVEAEENESVANNKQRRKINKALRQRVSSRELNGLRSRLDGTYWRSRELNGLRSTLDGPYWRL